MSKQSGPKGLMVVVCLPGAEPKIERIEKGLRPLQNLVGGYIEKVATVVYEGTIALDVFVHEEGQILRLEPNLLMRLPGVSLPLVGPVILVGVDERTGDTVDMADHAGMEKFAMQLAQSWPRAIKRF